MDKSRHLELIELVEDYMRALNTIDEDAYINVFSENCIVRDPYDKAEFIGEEGLRQFFKGVTQTWHYFEMRADNFYPGGDERIAVRWSVSATSHNRKTAEFSGLSIFSFEGDKISSLDAYWNIRNMLQQIQD